MVEQDFIEADKIVNLEASLKTIGFIKKNPLKNDYVNEDLGIILEDLHDENVLIYNRVPHFIDTVFYLTKEGKKIYQQDSSV